MNLLIPMAGRGQRFVDAGYAEPKPFIEFLGKRMIQHVVDAFPFHARKIFVMRLEHYREYGAWMRDTFPGATIYLVPEVTEGAACTCLIAQHSIDNDAPLAILNSDNIVRVSDHDALAIGLAGLDGAICVFRADGEKWSYARSVDGLVVEVAEKRQISRDATAGLYFWRKGSSFVRAAHQMIDDGFRVNGEFYVAPVYNWNIRNGESIFPWEVQMHGVGTPEDLQEYIHHAANRTSRQYPR